jgi:hypothetical protein
MAENLEDEIADNASGPKRAKGDMGEVEQHSLKDQIAADQYLAAKAAARTRKRGLRFTKLVPPGAD